MILPQTLPDLILALNLVPVIKGSVIVIQFSYVLFAFLLIQQIRQLNNIFCTPQGKFSSFISYVHLVAVLLIFILSALSFW